MEQEISSQKITFNVHTAFGCFYSNRFVEIWSSASSNILIIKNVIWIKFENRIFSGIPGTLLFNDRHFHYSMKSCDYANRDVYHLEYFLCYFASIKNSLLLVCIKSVLVFFLITQQYKPENKLSKMAKISKFIKDAAVNVFLVVNISEVLLNMKTYL